MQIKNKKLIGALACASALATAGVFAVKTDMPQSVSVKAAKTSVSSRSYGVDVASYQSTNLSSVSQAGSQFAIVKVSEGTNYRNPKAKQQISSAIATNMMPMAYHFATFGANKTAAVSEAKYAVSSAKAFGLPKGSYIACDWETGQGNNVNGGKNASANAIVAFMDQIKAAGYQPLLYSGASLMKSNINTNTVLSKYPNSLWVASYASAGRTDTANFNYFPSMDGVAIWQFTDNWRGLSVDGNISLLPLSYASDNATSSTSTTSSSTSSSESSASTSSSTTSASSSSSTTSQPSSQAPTNPSAAIAESAAKDAKSSESTSSEVKTTKTIMHKAYVYDKNGNHGSEAIGAYNKVTVYGGVVLINNREYYKIGENRYVVLNNVDGKKRVLKHNAYVYNNKGRRVWVATLRKRATITTYGGSMKIHGKRYYRINKNRYVKVANFK